MKAAAIGAFVGVCLTAVVLGVLPIGRPVHAEPSFSGRPVSASGGELITSTTLVAENRQIVTMIDPQSRVLAVYQIDGTSGEVSLKSVRTFHWDLQLAEFNGTSPLPREIRALVEQPR